MKEKSVAIVLAGGEGVRMDADIPKQFIRLAGKPVIIHTLKRFEESPFISDIVVVCHKGHIDTLSRMIENNGICKISGIFSGGKKRQESSYIGVKNCPGDTEFVLIHDAVRPFITSQMIEDTLSAAKEVGAAGVAIDIDDTIIVQKNDFIKEIPVRDDLKRIQTPQGFRYQTIIQAHQWALDNGITGSTDDCGLVLAMGGDVKIVEGAACNIKLTDRTDLLIAEQFIKSGKAAD